MGLIICYHNNVESKWLKSLKVLIISVADGQTHIDFRHRLRFFDNYLFIIMEADDQALSIVDSIA